MPASSIEPTKKFRYPFNGNLSCEENAPEVLLLNQLKRSALISISVGIRYPVGQGLFTPFTPCHKFPF